MLSSNTSTCNPFPENDFTSKSGEDLNFIFGFSNSPHMHLDCLQFLDHVYLNSPPQSVPTVGRNPSNPAAAAKKDRHTKINTARGLRDRRMRLSLDVARKFFHLQDLLGYDKASRTIDWLLRSSSSAIRALGVTDSEAASSSVTAVSKSRRGKRGKKVQLKRASVGRESRRKARERARERTSQKRRLMRESGGGDEARICVATTQGGVLLCPSDSFHFQHTHTAFFHQDEQIEEFEFNGKPWEAYNSFDMSR